MISLRQSPENSWNALFAISIVAIAAAGWFLYSGSAQGVGQAGADKPALARAATAKADAGSSDAVKAIKAHTSDLSIEALGSATLEHVTQLAADSKVQVASFRTDHAADLAVLSTEPFVVVVEGSFPDVIAFMKKLEAPASKLAVTMVQISASDTGQSQVTATIGLDGFVFKEDH